MKRALITGITGQDGSFLAELFGQAKCIPQNEETPFNPANPYAAAKV